MKISDLKPLGVSAKLIDIWTKDQNSVLLPIQSKAITDGNALSTKSGNLLIISPTSSGKTFLGELLALNEAANNRKSIILVPYVAIAEELYASFIEKYCDLRLNIAISNRDNVQYDKNIRIGNYDIAIIVYEKMTALLLQQPTILEKCSLLVIDEIQMLMDRQRGAQLELLITKLLIGRKSPRIVALSAVLHAINDFDKWLQASVIRDSGRPVELHEGVIAPAGSFRFKSTTNGDEFEESFPSYKDKQDGIVSVCDYLISQGEQCLVFCSTRNETEQIARKLAANIQGLTACRPLTHDLTQLPSSQLHELLLNLSEHNVSIHNSDLSAEERRLVEEAFRKQGLLILVSTSSLAMGVNLPAKNIIIYSWDKFIGRNTVDISVSEYKNMAGRSGRYKQHDTFGRSIMLSDSDFDADRLYDSFVLGLPEDFSSALSERPIELQVLDIVSSGLAKSPQEIRAVLLASFNGMHNWTNPERRQEIADLIATGIDKCLEAGALASDDNGKSLKGTPKGIACVRGGFTLDHLLHANRYFETISEDVIPSVLFYIARMDDETTRSMYHIQRPRSHEYDSGRYQMSLQQLNEVDNVGSILSGLLDDNHHITYEECVFLRRGLSLCLWISDEVTKSIEKKCDPIQIGPVRNSGQVASWYIQFFHDVCRIDNPKKSRHHFFRDLAERLSLGSSSSAIDLCRIRNSGLSRDECIHLAGKGIACIEDVLTCDPDTIPLSKRKRQRLLLAAQESIADAEVKLRRQHEYRLREKNHDTKRIQAIYTSVGTDLERKIEDLISSPFFEENCSRVERQKEGDPDLLFDWKGGVRLAASVTASDPKLVSYTKCNAVIGQSTKYNPKGHIVFGRADFEKLAITDANQKAQSGLNYKLITIGALAELYVLFVEERLTSHQVSEFLLQVTGYVPLRRVMDYAGVDY